LSFTKYAPNDQTDIVLIKEASHAADTYASRDDDSEALKEARRKIILLLRKWLQD
jgi:hypothetical protein